MRFRFCSPSANDSFGRSLLAQAKKPSVEGLWMAGCFEPAGCPLARCLQLLLVFEVVLLRGILILWVELHRLCVYLQNVSWISPNYLVYSFSVADKSQERGKCFNLLPCVLKVSHHVSTLNQSVIYNSSALICLWSMHQTTMLLLVAFSWLLYNVFRILLLWVIIWQGHGELQGLAENWQLSTFCWSWP